MKTCSAASCSNNSLHHTDLTWHTLPKNRWIRDQWIDLLGISEFAINSTTRICSSHFKNKDFQHNRHFLKPDVIPSVRLADNADSPSNFKEDDDSDLDISDDNKDTTYCGRIGRTKRVMYPTTVKEEAPVETTRPSRRAARMAAEKILNTVRKFGVIPPKRESAVIQIHVDLEMECYEDVLTSAQLVAHSKAQQLYDETNRKMRQYRFENAVFIYSNTDDDVPVTTPDPTPAAAPPPPTPNYRAATVLTGTGRTPRSMLFTNKAKIDDKKTIPSSSLAYKVVLATPPPLIRAPETPKVSQTKNSSVAHEVITIDEETAVTENRSDVGKSLVVGIPNIKGGQKPVTARSLMAVRVNIASSQETDLQEQANQLEGIIENEKILEEPIKWFVKLHLVAERPACRFCVPAHCNTGLEEDSSALDGFVWRCYGCTKSTPVTRLTFFARFSLSLPKLLKLIYHWVVQSDIDLIAEGVDGDVYMARTVFRALQDVCTRSLANKSNKIGGRGLVVEVGTAQLGNFFIVGAYDRRTKVTRLKVISTSVVANLTGLVQKQLDAWLHSHTIVISSDSKMNGRSRTGLRFQHANNDSKELENVMDYLNTYLAVMFGDLLLCQLKIETVQGFLDELQWRTRFGKTAWSCFFNMIKDIGQQSGKKVEMSMYEVDLSRMLNSSKTPSSRPQQTSSQSSKITYSLTKPVTIIQKKSENTKLHSSSIPSSPSSDNSVEVLPPRRDRKRCAEEMTTYERKRAKMEEEESEVAVILDEYYYARKESGPFKDDKDKNYQFKCFVCTKIVDNNVKLMKHLMAHIENSRQKNPDLSDLTQCKYCFRDFDTPYSMQCHVESVHLNMNDLACQICNQAFSDTSLLIYHMKSTHVQSEMPYHCQICGFRSSFHREVVEHFQQVHNGSDRVFCHYCLKIYQIRFSSVEGIGFVQGFYYHLYKHQVKSTMKKCNACCLVFFNNGDWKNHKANEHGSMTGLKGVTPMQCHATNLVLVKDPHKKPDAPKSKTKTSFTVPAARRRSTKERTSDNNNIILPDDIIKMRCVECNKFIEKEHFERAVSCSKCRFNTNCCEAFVEHMICNHSSLEKKRFAHFKPSDSVLPNAMFCICGFSSDNGDAIALHMYDCQKKTCHISRDKALAATVKREPEDDNTLEMGSAFFPPLVVLEEDEEKVLKERFGKNSGVDLPVSEQSENEASQQPLVEVSEKTQEVKETAKENTEESRPCMLNALGLIRRRSSSASQAASPRGESENSREGPPVLSREEGDSAEPVPEKTVEETDPKESDAKEDCEQIPPELESQAV